jgi:hypothetical protein
MAAYDTFKLWYAKAVSPNNTFAAADATHKLENVTTPVGEEVSLIYVLPSSFAKRTTDVSNALAVDPTSPDTGTGQSNVILRFVQQRTVTPTIPVLPKLLAMFYEFQSDDTFQKGRMGLESTDNPELDCLPIPTAGYKLLSFKQEPNQNHPGVQIWEVVLKFVGDNSKLGTRS